MQIGCTYKFCSYDFNATGSSSLDISRIWPFQPMFGYQSNKLQCWITCIYRSKNNKFVFFNIIVNSDQTLVQIGWTYKFCSYDFNATGSSSLDISRIWPFQPMFGYQSNKLQCWITCIYRSKNNKFFNIIVNSDQSLVQIGCLNKFYSYHYDGFSWPWHFKDLPVSANW